jgi:hypothetical protein
LRRYPTLTRDARRVDVAIRGEVVAHRRRAPPSRALVAHRGRARSSRAAVAPPPTRAAEPRHFSVLALDAQFAEPAANPASPPNIKPP